jgi:hypothetical protein
VRWSRLCSEAIQPLSRAMSACSCFTLRSVNAAV